MIVAFRPEFHPDELLFGNLSRHRRITGFPPAAAHVEALFGNRTAVAAVDMPVGLGALARRLGAPGLNGESLAIGHTLYPYYSAFLAPARRKAAMSAVVSGNAGGLKTALGLVAFRIQPLAGMRWCPECAKESVDLVGEGCWLRSHQLPGSLVCHLHGRMLSSVELDGRGRHEFRAPDPAKLPASVPSPVHGAALETLRGLAAAQASLLAATEPRELDQWSGHYRGRLEAAGFVPAGRQVDQERLEVAFRAFYGTVLPFLPAAVSSLGEKGWLAAMTRRHRKAFHPLLHAMLDMFLDAQAMVPGPFGAGPWPCLNRLSGHHGEAVVSDMHHYSNRTSRIGVFTCGCGHSFTRGLSPTGIVGAPRFRSGGPLLDAALRRLVVPGASLRSVGRETGLDPKTVIREAKSLGLPVPWSTRPSGSARRAAVAGGKMVRATSVGGAPTPRRDWSAVDEETVRKLLEVETTIRQRDPPEMVTYEALERESVGRGWLRKRAAKLPRSQAVAVGLVERLADFQRRRVETVLADLPLAPPWKVARVAGLKGAKLDWVREVMRGTFL